MNNMYGRGSTGRTLDLSEELEDAQHAIRQYEATLSQLRKMPSPHAAVVAVVGTVQQTVILAAGSSVLEVPMPALPFAKNIRTGSVVKCHSETMAITDLVESPEIVGEIVTVRCANPDGYCEVDYKGAVKRIRHGFGTPPEPGDRVVVDGTASVAVKSLGKDDSKFSFTGDTGVSWDDVGGLEQAKADMREAVEMPFKHPEVYRAYGKKPARGVMLFGPPGCGKTMLAKAVATSMGSTHGPTAAQTGFVYVKGPELLDKFVGQTESQIRALFARTREHFKKHGYPAVLFIDEADALLGRRGARLNMGTETTVVPQFLSEMDGLDEAGCIILLATNRPDTLDPAITREGRIDVKVRVTRPALKDVEEILRMSLKRRPIAGGADPGRLAVSTAEDVMSPSHVLYEIKRKDAGTEKFTLASLVSGSMVAAVVEKAASIAMREDVEARRAASGISRAHMDAAVKSVFEQNLHTNHDEALDEFCEAFRDQVTDVRRPNGEKSRLIRLS